MTRIRFGPSSQAMLRAIWRTADLDELYDTQAWSYVEVGVKNAKREWEIHTLFVIVPLILAMRMMLPPFPNLSI